MKSIQGLIAVVAVALLASGCARVKIEREYADGHITKEVGSCWGTMNEVTSKFNMARRDQRGLNDYVEESAGADAQWTHQAAQLTLSDLMQTFRVLGALAAASQGLPAGMNFSAPPMTMNIPAAPPANDRPTTGGVR